ncbi:CHAT domain-containing protein [Microcoleus sp. ARI1-B5]|uniref:CHAT domain-containing protein n=1 Tax=unclassified Microcoleus TaxID=2642155 RepID=UPI002FD68E65
MDENRVRAYLNLIQLLLSCPSGEEGNVLQEHSEFVDSGLIEVMQEVASRMAADGEQNAAFLQQLAGQISQALAQGTQGGNADRNSVYLQLINALLSCRNGEEEQLLQANSQLLDAGFLQACEAVAATLAEEGEENGASFLRNLASQVGEFLGMNLRGDSDKSEGESPQEYSRFILELLQAEQDSKSDVAVIYPLLAQRQHLLNARLAETLQQVADNLIAEHPEATRDIVGIIENLSIHINNFPLGKKANNIEIAIAGYQRVLSNREPGSEKWAETQNNLANAYRNRIRGEKAQNIEMAIAFYTAALSVRTRDAFPQDWATTQNNLANAYSKRIRGEKAQNIEMAILYYRNALKVRTRDAFPQSHAETLFNLGLAYRDVPNLQLAHDTFADAINTVELLRSEIHSGDETKQKLAEEWNELYRNMVEVCIELKNYTAAIEYAERSKARNLVELLATRDLYPKGDIPETVINELSRLRREIDAEQRRVDIEQTNRNSNGGRIWGERSPQIDNLQSTSRDQSHLTQLRQQLDELIDRDIIPIDPNFVLTQKVKGISYSEIQSLTAENTAIIEWYITGDRLLAFIITSESPTPTVWQSSKADFQALVNWGNEYLKDYRKNKTQWRENLAVSLENLAKILHLDDLLGRVAKKCDRLILIPHRYLHLFPIHALPVSREIWQRFNSETPSPEPTNPCLLDCFKQGVSHAPSCQLLQQAQRRKRPNFTQLFAVQNPTNDLKFTDIEVQAIRHHFPPENQDILIQSNAKKSAINDSSLRIAHCTHFSCHGYFNFEQPLLSALLLADSELPPPPPESNPNRYQPLQNGNILDLEKCLTLADIFALDLRECRLVVLSACETGISDFNSISDEYISLPSGFLVAGSSSVVPTLWTVNDLSTSFLTIKFYENLQAGLSVAVALNTAQIWLRDVTVEKLQQWTSKLSIRPSLKEALYDILDNIDSTAEPPFRSPYYWAAFYATGQ